MDQNARSAGVQPWTPRLAPKNGQLVPQHQDLQILRPLRSHRQHNQPEHTAKPQGYTSDQSTDPPSTDSKRESKLPAPPSPVGMLDFLNPTRLPPHVVVERLRIVRVGARVE